MRLCANFRVYVTSTLFVNAVFLNVCLKNLMGLGLICGLKFVAVAAIICIFERDLVSIKACDWCVCVLIVVSV